MISHLVEDSPALMSTRRLRANAASSCALVGVILLGLVWAKTQNYLLFHTLAESFSILIATSIAVLAWKARRFQEDNYLTFLGIAFLFIGGLDFVHTLVYQGMGVFPGYDANPATQIWVCARCLQSLALLIAPFFIGRKMRAWPALVAMSAASVLSLLAVFRWQIFPDCFLKPGGLTPFKRDIEYAICGILLVASAVWLRRRGQIESRVLRLLVAALVVTIAQEVAFTLYQGPYSLANFIGHCLKIVSYYLVYKAIIETALDRPYDLLFFDLVQKERELARSNSDLEQFASVVSHDLRSPLMSGSGFIELLHRQHGHRLDAEANELLEYARESMARMKCLISSLMEYARAGRGNLRMSECNSQRALTTALRALKVVLDASQAVIAYDPLPTVRGDEPLLSEVFQNLIENAVKYRADRPPCIHVSVDEQPREYVFCVRDNGLGIAPEHKDHIFQIFVQLHADSSPDAGLGIGLATCKRIVEKHGGRMWVESTPGEGSAFFLTLPR